MNVLHVEGSNKGRIMLYALSTCGWCKKTKALLKQLGVAYDYIDVDLLEGEDKDKITEIVKKFNPRISFPTIVINDDVCIAGFDEEKLKKELNQ